MKRHTNINIRKIGLGVFVLAILLFGGVAFCRPSWAEKTATKDVPVRFTFNSMIKLTVSEQTIAISDLTAGTNAESEPITITVNTNNASGYYLSATAGTKDGNTDLTDSSSHAKFTHLGESDNTAKGSMADSTWGISFAVGSAPDDNFTGLPLEKGDNGATGKKLINTSSAADSKNVQLKVGAKASASQAAGTYTNKINFYAVANN